jgi:hypothetical protein
MLAMLLGSLSLWAQAEQFNYQAVVRDGSGSLIKSQTVTVKIGIYDGGTLSYEETHSVNTDAYGLLNLKVGNGTATSGTFSNLDWANKQYQVKVEVDNGNGFQNLGQQPLSSVPYALHAASAPAGALDALTDVNAAAPSANQVLKYDGSNWVPGTDNSGSSSAWSSSGGTVYYNGGNVGVGTSSPAEALDVQGNVVVGDSLFFGSRKLYAKGFGLAINGDIVPEPAPSFTTGIYLGTSSNYWARTYTEDIYVNEIKDGPASANFLKIDLDTIQFGSAEAFADVGAYEVGVNSSLEPMTGSPAFSYDLGSSSNKWDDIYATNGTIQTSDRRSKKDITKLDYGLEEVMAIRPVTFRWKDKPQEKKKIGVIAQQVQPILNEVVKTHDWKRTEDGQLQKVKNERLGVYYADMIPVLIKAIQEQQSQIEELKEQKEELDELRNTVAELQAEIQKLK